MTRAEATEVRTHALKAVGAIKRIEEVVAGLPSQERSGLAGHLADAVTALESGILKEIYDRFPDLRLGPEEAPQVSSTLRWDDRLLPTGVSKADLDAVIYSVLKPNWQKTAMVIVKTQEQYENRGGPDVPFEELIGARIQVLAETKQIEGCGNLTMWRHSEVRLRQG